MTKKKVWNRTVRQGNVCIFPCAGGVDVFTGKGWESWSRFSTKAGFPELVAGRAVSEADYSTIHQHIKRK